jgi:hypothetical protein
VPRPPGEEGPRPRRAHARLVSLAGEGGGGVSEPGGGGHCRATACPPALRAPLTLSTHPNPLPCPPPPPRRSSIKFAVTDKAGKAAAALCPGAAYTVTVSARGGMGRGPCDASDLIWPDRAALSCPTCSPARSRPPQNRSPSPSPAWPC